MIMAVVVAANVVDVVDIADVTDVANVTDVVVLKTETVVGHLLSFEYGGEAGVHQTIAHHQGIQITAAHTDTDADTNAHTDTQATDATEATTPMYPNTHAMPMAGCRCQ